MYYGIMDGSVHLLFVSSSSFDFFFAIFGLFFFYSKLICIGFAVLFSFEVVFFRLTGFHPFNPTAKQIVVFFCPLIIPMNVSLIVFAFLSNFCIYSFKSRALSLTDNVWDMVEPYNHCWRTFHLSLFNDDVFFFRLSFFSCSSFR